MRRISSNRNLKDVLVLHDYVRPHTSLHTRQKIAKKGRTALPQPSHSPVLAPFGHQFFGPVKEALRGRHFAEDNELKQSFRYVLRSRSSNFHNTGTRRLTERWQ